jgi:hypothetical protein
VLRSVLYVAVLILGLLVRPLARLSVSVGLILSLFCLIFRPDQLTPMLAGGALVVSGLTTTVCYEALLRYLAPSCVVIGSCL